MRLKDPLQILWRNFSKGGSVGCLILSIVEFFAHFAHHPRFPSNFPRTALTSSSTSYGALQTSLPALSLTAGPLLFLLQFRQLLFDPLGVVGREAQFREEVIAVECQIPVLGILDLRSGEAIRVGQVGPLEVGLEQVGLLEVGPKQDGPLEVGKDRVSPLEVRLGQVGPLEVGPVQVGPL